MLTAELHDFENVSLSENQLNETCIYMYMQLNLQLYTGAGSFCTNGLPFICEEERPFLAEVQYYKINVEFTKNEHA